MGKGIFSNVILPFFILAVALVGAVGFIVAFRNGVEPAPISQTQEQEKEALSGWVTYRSEELGIEFEYPREYLEDEEFASRCGPKELNNSLRIATRVSIEVVDLGESSLQEYINQFDGTEDSPYPHIWITNSEDIDVENIQIDGAEDAMIISHPIDPWYIGSSHRTLGFVPGGKTAFIRKGNLVFLVRYDDGVSACGSREREVDGKVIFEIGDLQVFDRMVLSFNFI